MRAKSLALLTLALGCGLVASIGITQVMAKRSASVPIAGATENIYVAACDVPLNEVLAVGMLKLEQWPKDKVPPGAVGKLEDVEGRRCRTRLYAGEAILKTKLFGKGQDIGGSSSQIPKGMRVVPVRVDAVSGGSGLILPGDRVDLLVHLLANPAAGIREPCTRTVLQNIKVFAADATTDLERVNGDGKSIQAKTISLLVTPEQAQKITLATELGQVRLVMRSPEDDSQAKVDGITPRELFGFAEAGKLTKDQVPREAPKSSTAEEFMAMFKAMQAKQTTAPATEPTAPESPERYRMRLLAGEQHGEAVFEAQKPQAGAKADWTLVSETLSSAQKKAAEAKKTQTDVKGLESATAPQATKTVAKDAQGRITGTSETVVEHVVE
jgi:pilus assembly protein CpaB